MGTDHLTSYCADLMEQIQTMKSQEETIYKCYEYSLSRESATKSLLVSCTSDKSICWCNDTTAFGNKSHVTPRDHSEHNEAHQVDHQCRLMMAEWHYRMVDHFGWKRDLVAIAMNLLDRYVHQTPHT